MLHYAYRFASRAAAEAAIAAAQPAGLDVIGIALADAVLDTEGEVVTPGAPLPGWHVNAAWASEEPAIWAAARIPATDAPRWWSGVPRVPPPPAPRPVPEAVTNFQARAVLRGVIMPDGRSLETVVRDTLLAGRSATAALPEAHPQRMQADRAWLAWEQSNHFYRNSPLVLGWISQLGMTAGQVDDLFRAAEDVAA